MSESSWFDEKSGIRQRIQNLLSRVRYFTLATLAVLLWLDVVDYPVIIGGFIRVLL